MNVPGTTFGSAPRRPSRSKGRSNHYSPHTWRAVGATSPKLGGRGSAKPGRSHAGLTLVELILAMLLVVTLSTAVGYAFVAGLDMQRVHNARLMNQSRIDAMRQRITRMLKSAKLITGATDPTTYFQGTATGQSSAGDLGCDQLTFTTTAPGIPISATADSDDFETQMDANGPIGGVAEVSYSTTPVGNPPNNQTGLFERIQRPSDGDPTQGGVESLLSPEVAQMGFQFWNGQQWMQTWDTTIERRLPSAVLVSYILQGASNNNVQTFIVPIPSSDVTVQNPALNAGNGQ